MMGLLVKINSVDVKWLSALHNRAICHR